MLLALSLPTIHDRVICSFKTKQYVLTIAEEAKMRLPLFDTEPSELPAVLVLDNQNGVVVIPTLLVECDQTAAIVVHIEQAHPLTLAVVARQAAY